MDKIAKKIGSLLPRPLKKRLSPLAFEYLGYKDYRAAMRGQTAGADAIAGQITKSFGDIRLPLILVSQIQRSGGTLLSQLFDGHSRILAHPHELKIGYPLQENWPPIDPAFTPEKQFKILFELATVEMSRKGFVKGTKDLQAKTFLFLPKLQREIFKLSLLRKADPAERDVLDSYFTSYFNAWLNRRSIISEASFVTGFVPMVMADENNMDRFWNAYPDGYLISVIRSPLSWYPSAKRLGDGTKFGDLAEAGRRWQMSVDAIRREKGRQGDRVIVIHFDDLVTDTESVMRHVCRRVGLPYEDILSRPTFNNEPIGANTSFDSIERGTVSSAPVNRDQLLDEHERRHLAKSCMPVYQFALADLIENPAETARSAGIRIPSSAVI